MCPLSSKCFHQGMEECSYELGSNTILAPLCINIIQHLFQKLIHSLWIQLVLKDFARMNNLIAQCMMHLNRNQCEEDCFTTVTLELWKLKVESKFRSFLCRSLRDMIWMDHFIKAVNCNKVLSLLKPKFLSCSYSWVQ